MTLADSRATLVIVRWQPYDNLRDSRPAFPTQEESFLTSDLPVRLPSLAAQIEKILSERMSEGMYPTESQLPTENQLAEEFSVSRATIRSALDALAARHLVVRKQGIGTFITQIARITNPLSKFIDFNDLIAENGFEPSFHQLHAEIRHPDEELAGRLKLSESEEILAVHKIFYADGKPVIYCVNHIPVWLFSDQLSNEQAVEPGVTEPLLAFFERYCERQFEYFSSTVRAEISGSFKFLLEAMEVDQYTPVLVIDEIGYCDDERPVHNSVEYHPGKHMEFGLLRRRE